MLKMEEIGAKGYFFESVPNLGSKPHGVRQGVDGVRHLYKMVIGPDFGLWLGLVPYPGVYIASSKPFLRIGTCMKHQ